MTDPERMVGPGDVVGIRGEQRQIIGLVSVPGGVMVWHRLPREVAA